MPSTVTFPLWFCLTLTYPQQKHLGKEGKQNRSSPGEAALVPCFCSCTVPPPAQLPLASTGPLPQQELVKNGESSLQDSEQEHNLGEQEPPWAGEPGMTGSGPSYDFSSLALNLSAKKRSMNRKALAGCAQLGGRELQIQLGWAGPSPPAWLASTMRPVWLQQQPKKPPKPLQIARSCKKSSL